MRKTYLYKAKINKHTEANCNNWLELCCNLYNQALSQRITAYKEHGKTLSAYDQNYHLPPLRKSSESFRFVGSQVLEDVISRLDKAYKAFFRRVKTGGKAGFPRFKSAKRYDSFTLRQAGWELKGRYLHIKKVGVFKLFLSRPIEGKIKTITVRRRPSGKWFVAFSCDEVPVKKFPEVTAEIGIDVGIKSFLVDSEGDSVENPKYFRASEKVLRRKQRVLSRRKKGSARRRKARLLVAKAHEKISNQRKDFLHKVANSYVSRYSNIFIEKLIIKNMVRNRHLAKSISDSSWGMFFDFLTYKAEEAGRTVTKVNPRNTSQNCSGCGEKVPKTLSVRVHKCPHCNLILDRDHNASLNILSLGQSVQALTHRFQTGVV